MKREGWKKRLLSAVIALLTLATLLLLAPLGVVREAEATNYKYYYNPNKAITAAPSILKEFKSGVRQGQCAEYVSAVLRAGGLTNVKESGAGSLINFLNLNYNKSFGGKIGTVIVDPKGSQLSPGDVLCVVCNQGGNNADYTQGHTAGKGKYWGLHVVFVSKVCSNTKVEIYGWNNEAKGKKIDLTSYANKWKHTSTKKAHCDACVKSGKTPMPHLIAFHFNDEVKQTTVTVTFDANEGNCNTNSKTVTYGQTYGTLPTPTWTGHNFLGWYDAQTGGNLITASTKVTKNVNHTLYAHWELIENYPVLVTFDANGGKVSPSSTTVYANKAYGALPTPTRSLYFFDGWYTAASGGSLVTTSTIVSNSSPHTLYAHWSGPLKYSYDTDLALSKAYSLLQTAEKKKMKCAAYVSSVLRAGGLTKVNKSGAGDLIDYLNKPSNFGGTIGKVIINPRGSQLHPGDVLCVVCTKGAKADYTGAHSKGTGKYYGLHVLIVSKVLSDTKVRYYAANNYVYGNKDLDLTTYKVKCSKCGNSNSAKLIAFVFNDVVKPNSGGTNPTPTPAPTATPTHKPSATPTYKPSATPTYKPSATPTYRPSATPTYKPSATPTSRPSPTPITKYTIVFDPQGGTVSPTTMQVTAGNAIGSLPTPVRQYYTWDGWYTAKVGGTKITASYIPTSNMTLFAHWTTVLKYQYDAALAMSQAYSLLKSAESSGAKGATYVSSVLRAGGLTNVKQSGAGDLIDYINKSSNFGAPIGDVILNPKGSQLHPGDVICVVCTKGGNADFSGGHGKGSGKYYGLSVVIVSEVLSETKIKYYGYTDNSYVYGNKEMNLTTYKVKCSKCGNNKSAKLIAFVFNDAVQGK